MDLDLFRKSLASKQKLLNEEPYHPWKPEVINKVKDLLDKASDFMDSSYHDDDDRETNAEKALPLLKQARDAGKNDRVLWYSRLPTKNPDILTANSFGFLIDSAIEVVNDVLSSIKDRSHDTPGLYTVAKDEVVDLYVSLLKISQGLAKK